MPLSALEIRLREEMSISWTFFPRDMMMWDGAPPVITPSHVSTVFCAAMVGFFLWGRRS